MKRRRTSIVHRDGEFWAAMMARPGFSADDIARACPNARPGAIGRYVAMLLEAGFIAPERAGADRREPRFLIMKRHAEAPVLRGRKPSALHQQRQQQIWNAIRALKRFTIADLAYIASTEETQVPIRQARLFVYALHQCGCLLKVAEQRDPNGGPAVHVYRLKPSRNTGPRPLRVVRRGGFHIFDPNRNEVVNVPATDLSRSAA